MISCSLVLMLNGYEMAEKIVKLDSNIKICFMSTAKINYKATREIQNLPMFFDCYVRKPTSGTDSSRDLEELLDSLYEI